MCFLEREKPFGLFGVVDWYQGSSSVGCSFQARPAMAICLGTAVVRLSCKPNLFGMGGKGFESFIGICFQRQFVCSCML